MSQNQIPQGFRFNAVHQSLSWRELFKWLDIYATKNKIASEVELETDKITVFDKNNNEMVICIRPKGKRVWTVYGRSIAEMEAVYKELIEST